MPRTPAPSAAQSSQQNAQRIETQDDQHHGHAEVADEKMLRSEEAAAETSDADTEEEEAVDDSDVTADP